MSEDGPMSDRDWAPETEKGYEAARKDLKERFAAWCAANGTVVDADPGETLVHYKWGFVDQHMTRWTCANLDEVYLELHPAKVIAEESELGEMLAEAKTFIAFLADTGLLDPDSDPRDVLVDHLDRIEPTFRKNMADTSRYSVGKRLWTTARAEGVELGDEKAVQSFMQDFNARPAAQRDAALGRLPTGPGRRVSGRATPPGTPPRPKPSAKRKRRGR